MSGRTRHNGRIRVTAHDAVLVVPGIMGSELVDTANGRTLWGLRDPRWYVDAWTGGESLRALLPTAEEIEGTRVGRVRATQLLRFPAFAPGLRGFEPYGDLMRALHAAVRHPSTVQGFPYDWRLSVEHNAGLLARAAEQHLARWREHPEHRAGQAADPTGQDGRLVILAHSMGGLLTEAALRMSEPAGDVRTVVTFGTPFYGSPEVVVLLSQGRSGGLPLPAARARRLAIGLPSIYDLLPRYRCVDAEAEARQVTPADIKDLGADGDLARRAADRRTDPDLRQFPVEHLQIVGTNQPTTQSVVIVDGVAEAKPYTLRPAADRGVQRIDLGGDGTVPRVAASLAGTEAMPLAQTHGALARSSEAIVVALDVLARGMVGPWLGGGQASFVVPDVVTAGAPAMVRVLGTDDPTAVRCDLVDLDTTRRIDTPTLSRMAGALACEIVPPHPGLYRVVVTGGGGSPISQILMAEPS